MDEIDSPDVARVFQGYPESMRQKLLRLRQIVLDTASEIEGVDAVEETLKWGEPSYITKEGSTIRMGWKEKTPGQYAIYFNCNSSLVETFKAVYGEVFTFEGKRAIVFWRKRRNPSRRVEALHFAGINVPSREAPAAAGGVTTAANW